MGDVNLQLVREFFELNMFHVLTNWQQAPPPLPMGENTGQLFAENTRPTPPQELPFLLLPDDLPAIERAVVEVRAWHTDRFYPSVIEANPVLSQFVADESLALAREVFEHRPFTTILVLSELPANPELRIKSTDLLLQAGVDHAIEFPHILRGLLDKITVSGAYTASETLQTLRLLKRYKLVRDTQMEFFFTSETHPTVEVTHPPAEDDDDTTSPD